MNFSLKMLLAALAYAALLCASVLTINPWWAEILLLVTFFLLAIAASLALFGRADRRAAYGAFAVTAGAYLLLTVAPGGFDGFPTHQLAQDWNNQLGDYRAKLVSAPAPTTNISTTSPALPIYVAPVSSPPVSPYSPYAVQTAVEQKEVEKTATDASVTDSEGETETSPVEGTVQTAPANATSTPTVQPSPGFDPYAPAVLPPTLQAPVTVSPYTATPTYAVSVVTAYTSEQMRALYMAQQNFPRVCHAVFGTLLGVLAAAIVARVSRRGHPSPTRASGTPALPPPGVT